MYVAQKPCKFAGKAYKIGEIIDETAIQKTAAPRLIKMGVIAAVATNGAVTVEGGPLLPPSSTTGEAGETGENPDGQNDAGENPDGQNEAEEEAGTTYTKSGLLDMTKKEMLAIAAEMGVDANEDMTKADIADLIMQKQGE